MGGAIAPAGAVTPGSEAQWGARAIGFIIDSCIVSGVMIVLGIASTLITSLALGASTMASPGTPGADAAGIIMSQYCVTVLVLLFAALAVGAYNRLYLVSKRGYSIGQGVMRLKVVDGNGALLPMGSAGLRFLAQFGLSMVPLAGFLDLLWPLWDARRQTLHDKATGAFVIPDPLRR